MRIPSCARVAGSNSTVAPDAGDAVARADLRRGVHGPVAGHDAAGQQARTVERQVSRNRDDL
jgi:hypothetical protein